jgi:hypothetical protein
MIVAAGTGPDAHNLQCAPVAGRRRWLPEGRSWQLLGYLVSYPDGSEGLDRTGWLSRAAVDAEQLSGNLGD